SDWDMEIYGHAWTAVRVCTAQEEHGGGRCLIRVRFCLRPSALAKMLRGAALLPGVVAVLLASLPMGLLAAACLSVYVHVWCRGTRRASWLVERFERSLKGLNLVRC